MVRKPRDVRTPALKGERARRWKLQNAKARFSEVVRRARSEGPQRVTVRGQDAVVVLSAESFEALMPSRRQPSLHAVLSTSPPSSRDARIPWPADARARRAAMRGWLLDTVVISELRKPRCDPNVRRWSDGQPPDQLFLSRVTVAEIRFGIERVRDVRFRGELTLAGPHAAAVVR